MLSLTLKQGDYITIGDNVVLQYNYVTSSNRCKVTINAPREITIVRGEVLERSGETRPDCVFDGPQFSNRGIRWDRSKAQALSAMRRLLYEMDGRDKNVRDLRRQLEHMFPPVQEGGEPSEQPSPDSTGEN